MNAKEKQKLIDERLKCGKYLVTEKLNILNECDTLIQAEFSLLRAITHGYDAYLEYNECVKLN